MLVNTFPISTLRNPQDEGIEVEVNAKHYRRLACRAPGHLASQLPTLPLAAGRSQALLF